MSSDEMNAILGWAAGRDRAVETTVAVLLLACSECRGVDSNDIALLMDRYVGRTGPGAACPEVVRDLCSHIVTVPLLGLSQYEIQERRWANEDSVLKRILDTDVPFSQLGLGLAAAVMANYDSETEWREAHPALMRVSCGCVRGN